MINTDVTLSAEQAAMLEDLALRLTGTDDPAAVDAIAGDLAEAVLLATGFYSRLSAEREASHGDGREIDWSVVSRSSTN